MPTPGTELIDAEPEPPTPAFAKSSISAWWLLACMIVLWIVVMGRLVVLRHERFATYAYDLAIFDQATWLISRGSDLFMNVRGLEFLGHHANFGIITLAPFYWFGAGPNFLNLFQVVGLALGAVPVFLLARDRLGNAWHAVVLAGSYLLHPVLGFLAWETFHPESVAIPAILLSWWLASRHRWVWFALVAVYAISWKEDIALVYIVFGTILIFRRHRRVGAATALVGLGWFLLVNRIMIPAFSPTGEVFYNQFFGSLGNSVTEVAGNIIRNPTELTRRLIAPDATQYLWKLTAPFAIAPLLGAPAVAGLALPQFLVNLVGPGHLRVIYYHYAAIPLAGLTLAMVEGVATLGRRPSHRRFLVGLIASTSLAAAITLGITPIGEEYEKGWWPLTPDVRNKSKAAALALVPDSDSVSSTYLLTPHLSSRRYSYMYPVPWISNYWGVNGENLPNPAGVQWLVVDRQSTDDKGIALLDRLTSGGEFDVISSKDDIVVARRARKG